MYLHLSFAVKGKNTAVVIDHFLHGSIHTGSAQLSVVCFFQLWNPHALLTVMVGKWLLAIFHHVNALSIDIRNSVVKATKVFLGFFLSSDLLVLRVGMYFLRSSVLYVL